MAMELKHEGFSIREYVSRMRSANVVKCWPLDEGASEGCIQSLLPPITVKKFIWWLDDIESSSQVKVKCWRPKAKPPKKRSISEIEQGFCINASKLSSDHEDVNWGVKGMRKKKNNNKNKEMIVLEKFNKVIKGNDKEKCFSLNLQYQEKAIANSKSSRSRKNEENDIRDHVSIHKNKPISHTEKQDHQRNPKRGILKNHTKALISPPLTAKSISPETVQVNDRYGKHKADKHVTLIQKNITLGLKTNPSLPFESLHNMSHNINRGSQETRHLLHMGPRETPHHPNCIFPPGFSRLSHDYVTLPLNSRGELIALSSTSNRQTHIDLTKTNHGSGNILSPTMRLMGKEFTVGGKGFQGDGHIWKDELRFSNGPMMHHRDEEPSLEKSRDTFLFPSEITNNYGIGNTFPYHRPHNNNESFPFRDSCPFVSSSDIRLINKQNLPRAPISAVGFPFMHPDLELHVQSDSSGTHRENGSLLFFDAPEKMGSTSNFRTPDNLGCTHRPCMIPNCRIGSCVSTENEAFGSYNSFSTLNLLTQQGWKSEENQGTNQVKNWPW